jgi:hypothetical protein
VRAIPQFASLPVLLLCAMCCVPPAHAQEDESSGWNRDVVSEGFGLSGATGLVSLLSPAILAPGNIMFGFTYRDEFASGGMSAPPVTLGYGLARLSEAYVAFEPRRTEGGSEENEILVGFKLLGLPLGRLMIGAGAAYRSIDVITEGKHQETYAIYDTRLLLALDIGAGIRLMSNAGYSFSESSSPRFADHPMVAGGLSLPLPGNTMLVADVLGKMYPHSSAEIECNLALRLFLFEHIQLNIGGQVSRRRDAWYPGMLLGIGFSSQVLRSSPAAEEAGYIPPMPSLLQLQSGAEGAADGAEVMPPLPGLEELESRPVEEDAENEVPRLPGLDELGKPGEGKAPVEGKDGGETEEGPGSPGTSH